MHTEQIKTYTRFCHKMCLLFKRILLLTWISSWLFSLKEVIILLYETKHASLLFWKIIYNTENVCLKYSLKILFLYNMHEYLSQCMHVIHTCALSPLKPEDCIQSFGIRTVIKDGYELPHGWWEPSVGPLQCKKYS